MDETRLWMWIKLEICKETIEAIILSQRWKVEEVTMKNSDNFQENVREKKKMKKKHDDKNDKNET